MTSTSAKLGPLAAFLTLADAGALAFPDRTVP